MPVSSSVLAARPPQPSWRMRWSRTGWCPTCASLDEPRLAVHQCSGRWLGAPAATAANADAVTAFDHRECNSRDNEYSEQSDQEQDQREGHGADYLVRRAAALREQDCPHPRPRGVISASTPQHNALHGPLDTPSTLVSSSTLPARPPQPSWRMRASSTQIGMSRWRAGRHRSPQVTHRTARPASGMRRALRQPAAPTPARQNQPSAGRCDAGAGVLRPPA